MDAAKVREDFPILKRKVHGKPLVYLDSAATSQKPLFVIDSLAHFYKNSNANIHRGLHTLSQEATALHDEAREKVRMFIHAKLKEEIVLTRNATEAINLVAYSFGKTLNEGDVILLTEMEHHSNLVPWLALAQEKKVGVKYIPLKEDFSLDLKEAERLLKEKPKMLALTHVSNVLGTINPVKELIEVAHRNHTLVLVDACQSVPHMPVDVQDLDADFLVFSGHKMLAPTGIGVLYGKKSILEKMSPFLFGGDMIKEVSYGGASWNDLPYKFEAGTPDIAGAIGLGAAIDYLMEIGMENVRKHEQEIVKYALERLSRVKGLKMYGPLKDRAGLIAFNLADIHPHDLDTVLDEEGVAIRSGHHCAMPLHDKLGIPASARASFYVYTTKQDIDNLVAALERARKVFKL